jgi:glycosyltransferase involved in cell wall biosynthesis
MVQSVLNQTYKNWELLIVDDGSTDNTKQIIEEFKDPRIKYYYGINSGAADKRNLGVEKATSEFIIFLDSDDEVKVNWLELMVHEIKENKASVVTCGLEKHDYKGNFVDIMLPHDLGGIFNNTIANVLSGTILMKKNYFLEAGGYDIELNAGQHTEILIRLLPVFNKYEVKIANIFEPLIIIHLHEGERIRNNLDAIFSGSLGILSKHKELLEKNKEEYFDYISVAGVSAIKLNKVKEGKKLLVKAFTVKPFLLKSFSRLIIGYTPFLRNKYWGNFNK